MLLKNRAGNLVGLQTVSTFGETMTAANVAKPLDIGQRCMD